jgi:hypothetical protein
MLVNRSTHSLWRSSIDDQQSLASRLSDFTYNNDDDDDEDSNGDYADILSPEYEIDRKQIQMIELLGNGQFGEVYRGMLKVIYYFCFRNYFYCFFYIRPINN